MSDEQLFNDIRFSDDTGLLNNIASDNIDVIEMETGENLLQSAIAFGKTSYALELINKGINLNHVTKDKKSALHYAASHSNATVLEAILSKSTKIDQQDEHGNTPLWTAVFNARGQYKMVKALVSKGANPKSTNKYGKTPLDFAIQIGDQALVKILEEQ